MTLNPKAPVGTVKSYYTAPSSASALVGSVRPLSGFKPAFSEGQSERGGSQLRRLQQFM